MLEKRKGRSRGGSGSGGADHWDAPPLEKAQMAFEIIWFCIVLYLITVLIKVMSNVPSRHRQPYILLLVSAILLDIALIMDAIAIRIDDMPRTTYVALSTIISLLWQQPKALVAMAGLWVFRKRSQLITYGKGATGVPYAGQTWKFVADWMVASFILLCLILVATAGAVGYSLYYMSDLINFFDYKRFVDAQWGLSCVLFAFYFILTLVFVITGFTLGSAFDRQTGRNDVVRHFPAHLRTHVKFNQVTRQMLIWVTPWLTLRATYSLIDIVLTGMNREDPVFDRLALGLAAIIVSGACWSIALYGFIKTASDPGPWDWSHLQAQQPQMAPYNPQAPYAPPGGQPHQVQG